MKPRPIQIDQIIIEIRHRIDLIKACYKIVGLIGKIYSTAICAVTS